MSPSPTHTAVQRLALALARSLLPLLALAVLALVPLVGPHGTLVLTFFLWRGAARYA